MRDKLDENGYVVIRDFFDQTTTSLMQQYWFLKWNLINFCDEEKYKVEHSIPELFYNNVDTHDVGLNDSDVGYSYNFYNDTLSESICLHYGPKLCEVLNLNLSPTYTFARIYNKNSPLVPHIDRPSCEISTTSPILTPNGEPSQICVSNYTFRDIEPRNPPKWTIEEIEKKGDFTTVDLYPGDVFVYKGCERIHWRKNIPYDYLIQFFMHYVLAEGDYKDYVFDTRPFMGFPTKYKSSVSDIYKTV